MGYLSYGLFFLKVVLIGKNNIYLINKCFVLINVEY